MTVLLCLPGQEFPKISWLNKIWLDKWVHVGLFIVLNVLWNWFYSFGKKDDRLKALFTRVIIGAIVYGIAIELIQHFFIPFRSFEWGDIVADAVGSVFGFIISVKRFVKK